MNENVMSLDRIDEMMRRVFQYLKSVGGCANGTDVLNAISHTLHLTSYELEKTKTGSVRWDTHVRFYTSDCKRAGYLSKSNGVWTLTPAGESAPLLPPGQLIRVATKASRSSRQEEQSEPNTTTVAAPEKIERQAIYDKAQEQSRKEIDSHISELNPYDFQELVAHLLRAMGYHVSHIAPRGPDGGVDITAYKDPLGTTQPRIRVQVKHRETKVDAKKVRELEGLLRRDGDVGLMVSSGGFSSEASRELRSSSKHIETMDLSRLIELWQENYDKISESGKALFPLVKVFFLAPPDED